MVAKTVTAFIAGLGFGVAGALAANAVGFAFIAAHGYHVELAGTTILRYALGAVLGAALMAAVGVAIGTLIRSQIIAVVIVLVWGLALEAILAGVFTAVGPYLPYTACMTLASSHPGGGALGYATKSHTAPLPYLAAVALVLVLQAAPHDDPQVASPLAPVGAGSKGLCALGNDGGKLVEGFKSAGQLSPGAGELGVVHAALTCGVRRCPGRAPGAEEGTTEGLQPSRDSTSSSKAAMSKYVRSAPMATTSSPGSSATWRSDMPWSAARRQSSSAAASSSSTLGRRLP